MQRLLQSAFMLICWLCLLVGSAWAVDLKPIPTLNQPVMDTAQMLSTAQREQLNQQLLQYSREKGSQIVVLTVDSTAPEDIFKYGMRVVDKWQLGRAKQDDGVLLLIARDDRQNQILVGRGLEGVITDVDAHHIISQTMRPYFQRGDFDAGIVAAVSQLQGLIAGEALPAPTASSDGDLGGSWMALLIPFVLLSSFLKRIFGTFIGSMVGGGIAAGACLFFGAGFGVAIAAALGVFVFSLIFGSGVMIFPGGGGHSGGSWGGGGYSGGGSGGGSFGGGGGFSGGGGGFSGGGASGGW